MHGLDVHRNCEGFVSVVDNLGEKDRTRKDKSCGASSRATSKAVPLDILNCTCRRSCRNIPQFGMRGSALRVDHRQPADSKSLLT